MKITKSRLLQIIREEVELHEKNLEENTFELDEVVLKEIEDPNAPATEEPVATDKNGNVKNPKHVLNQAAAGELEEEATEEDQIIDPRSKEVVEPPKQHGKIEIKIR
jgi:hypothetical protein